MNALWFYDYFLTLADEVSVSLTLAAHLIQYSETGRICLVWKEVIWFAILPDSGLLNLQNPSFLVVYFGTATPRQL